MKLSHKILSAVLVCTMPLSFFTACGGVTQAQLEAYIKEKGYVTREEAEAIAAQNSGTTTIVQQTAESQDLVAAVNAALKAKGSNITVTEDKSLSDKAKTIASNSDSEEETLKSELQSQNLKLLMSESSGTESRAREIANVILKYEKEGKRVKAIGYYYLCGYEEESDFGVVTYEGLVALLSYEVTDASATTTE